MGQRQVGAGGAGGIVGAVLGLVLAAGCDSGESTPLAASGASHGGTAVAGSTVGGTPSAGASGSTTGGSSGGVGGGSGSGGVGGADGGGGIQAGGAENGGADSGASGEGGASAGGEGGGGGEETGGAAGTGGSSAGTGGVSLGGSGGSNGCQTAQLSFAPLPSTVMLLVDGSGTMFAGTGPTVWDRVRDALLPTIDAMDGQLNLGFLAMSAELDACPAFQEVAPAKNNYTPIAAKYSAIAKPNKGESPFPLALDRAGELLSGKAGDKHVIFVIDGEPDYCNDGQANCAIDSTVWRLQKLREAGVTTHVAALPFTGPPVSADYSATRQSYANAGAGLPVSVFGGDGSQYSVYYECYSYPKWSSDHVAAGKGAETLAGTYSAAPGAAPFSALDPSDASALQSSFQQLLAKTRSCSFEVTGGVKIALDKASTGTVTLDGQTLPFDAANGWHLQSQTVLQFSGEACTKLHASATAVLSFQFPCAAITN